MTWTDHDSPLSYETFRLVQRQRVGRAGHCYKRLEFRHKRAFEISASPQDSFLPCRTTQGGGVSARDTAGVDVFNARSILFDRTASIDPNSRAQVSLHVV